MAHILQQVGQTFKRNLSKDDRQHLTYVYSSLALASIAAAVGTYVYLFSNFVPSGLSLLAGFGLMFALYMTPHEDKNVNKRLGYLGGFAFFSGHGLGPLVEFSLELNPSLLLTALMSTFFIFGSFSFAALYARRGSYLFLGGPLGSLISMALMMSVANIFFGSYLLFELNLYIGVLIMSGYILYDTSIILEKRRHGDKDFIMHSIFLFIDLIGIFKRLLIILSNKEQQKKREK